MRGALSLFAVAVALSVMPGCKSAEQIAKEKEAAEADQKALQGKWTLAQFKKDEDAGEGGDQDKPGDMTIDKDVMRTGGEWLPRQKMTLYATNSPKQIDLVAVKEDGSPEQRKYSVWQKATKKQAGKWVERTGTFKRMGLYKVEGDTLTIALGTGESRASELSAGPDRQLLVYKRVGGKAADEKDKEKDGKDKKDKDKDGKDKAD